jgi:hypothetical protein
MKLACGVLLLLLGLAAPGAAQRAEPATIAEKTAGMEKLDGFFPLWWDARAGKMWLEITRWDEEFLYIHSLPAGVGSNDIGLDRGQLGRTRVVRFTRSGPRVLLVESNYRFRATADNPDEQRSVREAFAESVLAGFDVAAEEAGRALVDATAFFLSDAHNVAARLRGANQGTYRLDAQRSAFYLPRTKGFPRNTEVEVTLTFAGENPGGWVRSVVPTPEALTVRQRHSLVALPEPGYRPRRADPRGGFFGSSFMDFSAPVGEPIVQRFIARHRLEKRDPAARVSDVVRPIVYYVDRGAPEPIRTALVEGARWWAAAFEAAGFRNAFRVELLPEGADSMDIRYNVIQWVHRSTRGWSYGSSVADPRTGEIIKGHVTLGSLRVRQDYLIAEGLLAPYEDGRPVSPEMLRMALARLRQLSAHEVGHTLGIAHNYIASTANRASVMDYPHPWVRLDAQGRPDLSEAYAEGIGEWDKVAVAWGYSQFAPGADEAAELEKILQDAHRRGLYFLTDQDARPAGSASPAAHLWDNGADALAELDRVMAVRRAALSRFGERNIPRGAPLATLEETLVPVYLYHRYQVEAAAKLVGGVHYLHTVRGGPRQRNEIVAPEVQRRALDAVLATVAPEALALPEELLAMIPARAPGYPRSRETFLARTGVVFDALAPAEAAAHHSLAFLFHPERAARILEHHARDARYPSLEEVLDRILDATFRAPQENGYAGEIRRAVAQVALYHLMALAAAGAAPAQVRAMARLKLDELARWIEAETTVEPPAVERSPAERAHLLYAASLIEAFRMDPKQPSLAAPPALPDGPPIGANGAAMECSAMPW